MPAQDDKKRPGLWCFVEGCCPNVEYHIEWWEDGESIAGWFVSEDMMLKVYGLPRKMKYAEGAWFKWDLPIGLEERG